jgi:UDP-N-acetylmuramoyl-L-alanyl-D-glutamate--2,6-diaminopimelate ligase
MKFLRRLIPKLLLDLYHRLSAVAADMWYGYPSRDLLVIGVTGTNGKTTTTHFLVEILKAAGKRVGYISTIAIGVGGKEDVNETKMTTLKNCWQIQKLLRSMVVAGDEAVVIETTSHALDQYRVHRIWYDVAIPTNVSREHLDYHKTLESYRKAKERLFHAVAHRPKKVLKGREISRTSIVNTDDASASHFLRHRVDIRCGFGETERPPEVPASCFFQLKDIKADRGSVRFVLGTISVELAIPGRFTVENAAAALTTAKALDILLSEAVESLRHVAGVPGRLESIHEGQPFAVYVDYAVTPDAFRKLAQIVRQDMLGSVGKWWWVFGATGERDRGKRPILGKIAASEADYVVLTNEDPYHEDPERILDEVEQGVKKTEKEKEKTYWRFLDRKKAIQFACTHAKPGDLVMITGKGQETSMAMGDARIPWNEREIVREILRGIKKDTLS